jgi:Uma2 family endonuclease
MDQLPTMYAERTQAADGFARRAFTVHDVRRMIDVGVIGEEERIELIEGDITVLSPKPIAHERIKSALNLAMLRMTSDYLMVAVAPTLQLTETVLIDPDIAVFPRSAFRPSAAGFAALDPGEACLIVEIAASNLPYDRSLKARLYARHNVREFWVIDANKSVTWVHTDPVDDGWGSIAERGPDEILTTSAPPGFAIRVHAIG